MKKKPRSVDETPTASVPAPPLVPRELLSERELLLELHGRLDSLDFDLRSLARELEKVSRTLIEHDRAWFVCMNFLEAQARDAKANGRADLIRAAIDRRVGEIGDGLAIDEKTNPGDG